MHSKQSKFQSTKSRRQFLQLLCCMSLAPAAILLPGCTQTPKVPIPFQTGSVIAPPLGCSELRESDENGDC